MSLLKYKFGNREVGEADAKAPDAVSCAARLRAAAEHRIRVGLTGLAAIFLLVLVAAAGLRPTQSLAAADTQAEPLAVLGVAPGAGPAATAPVASARTERPSRT